jgi:hypothetical protein
MFSKLETWLRIRAERRKQEKLRRIIRDQLYDRHGLRQLLLILQSEASHRWNEETDGGLQGFLQEEMEGARLRFREERARAASIAENNALCSYRPKLPIYP